MTKRLAEGFDAIKKGRSVDWRALKTRLLKTGATEALINDALSAKAYGDKDYQVVIKDEQSFDLLQKFAEPSDLSSRSAASITGNTHSTRVNGAMLAAWGIGDATPYNHVFMADKEIPQPNKRHALIIENLECFLNKDDTCRFVKEFCGVTYPVEDVEFIMGAGNSISNRLIIPYLKSFKGEVMCLLDVDLGGLKIYANLLSAGVPLGSLRYLVPDDLTRRLRVSRREAGEKELEGLLRMHGLSPVTDRVISAIQYYKKTLEQESYRAAR